MYTHPDALQRVCEEVERVVWPIDRDFEHAGRGYWVRPAEQIEIAELETTRGVNTWPNLPPGLRYYTVVVWLGQGSECAGYSTPRTSAPVGVIWGTGTARRSTSTSTLIACWRTSNDPHRDTPGSESGGLLTNPL